jgi:hypothetical protein
MFRLGITSQSFSFTFTNRQGSNINSDEKTSDPAKAGLSILKSIDSRLSLARRWYRGYVKKGISVGKGRI